MNKIFLPYKKSVLFFFVCIGILSIFIGNFEYSSSSQDRVLLSSLKFTPDLPSYSALDFSDPLPHYKILKVKTRDGIFIEIYSSTKEDQYDLTESFKISSYNEGYMMIGSNAISMATVELSEDGLSIVIPGFDKNFTAHLDILKYNPLNRSFDLLQK